jgi:hypothetical protein
MLFNTVGKNLNQIKTIDRLTLLSMLQNPKHVMYFDTKELLHNLNSVFNPPIVFRENDSYLVYLSLDKECQEIKEEVLVITMLLYQTMQHDRNEIESASFEIQSESNAKRVRIGRRLKKMIDQLPIQ